jgi:hypothetical protein
MTNQANPEQIARGLSVSLQRELLRLSAAPEFMPVTWLVRYGYRLEQAGLAKRTTLTDRSALTPLGLVVRRYLQEQSNAE